MPTLELPKKRMELLAPAGDWDSLLAGIAAGADAVYLGGKAFNARQNAANFELEQLREAADLLHLHGKKIYVTVNTLVAESELAEALEYLNRLYNLGVDAIIIQDLGLINLARQYLPGLELHASTQMTVHNREGAVFLKGLGIKRVVLARELTAAEVESIAGRSGIEVEVFVHGALCVCYSGQCLMSSMIGGRSGNRGRCAQPCRLEYQIGYNKNKLIPTQGSHLLSPKDIALITEIPELHRVGVASLKIEGRMKRPEYVYQVVKVYRRALERYWENPGDFSVAPQEVQELEQSFNRGFSTGYFGGNRNSAIMGFSRPNNRGVYLGRISSGDRLGQHISLKLEADLETGDEVEVWVSQGGRAAGTVKELISGGQAVKMARSGETVSLALPGRFHPGDRVFKISAVKSGRETKEALGKEHPDFKIACSAEVHGELGTALNISYYDQHGHHGNAVTEIPLQPARNRPLTKAVLLEQLGKLGNTPYYLTALKFEIAGNLMMPLSELNQARRRAIEALTTSGLEPYRKEPLIVNNTNLFTGCLKKISGPNPERKRLSVWTADFNGVIAAANAGADLIYAGGDELTGFRWTEEILRDSIDKAHHAGSRLVIGLPRINREDRREEWHSNLQMILKLPADGVMVSDLGALQLALSQTGQAIYLNYTFNFFNSFSISLLKNTQIKQITLSPELTLEQIREIKRHQSGVELECLVQGALELMVSEYCPLDSILSGKGECRKFCRQNEYFLRDRLQLDFPIYTDQFCRLHLLNAKELCLFEDLARLTDLPELVLRLELKTYPADNVGLFVEEYRRALAQLGKGKEITDSEEVIQKFKSLTSRGITKGHYFRGVD